MYPATNTTVSPNATQPTENQKGSPKNVSSQPTINALDTIGNNTAIARRGENMIPTQAIAVATVPNKMSKDIVGELRFANKHPRINPIAYFLLKKQTRTSISEMRNWIGPYEKGVQIIVKIAYNAARTALLVIILMASVVLLFIKAYNISIIIYLKKYYF